MIDTVILLVGFLCVGMVSLLCAAEYGFLGQRSAFFAFVRRNVRQGPSLHSLVLGLAFVGAVVSSVVSSQINYEIELAQQEQSVPSAAALTQSKP